MLRILYVDDEKDYLPELRKRHPDDEIIYHSNIGDLEEILEKLHGTKKWPDLLLLDIYWPSGDLPEEEVEEVRRKTKDILQTQVEPAIENLITEYTMAFQDFGIDVLRDIRQRYGAESLPIVLYTSKGYFLLKNQDWLGDAVKYEAEWLGKGTASALAESRLFKMIVQGRKPGRRVFIGHGRSLMWREVKDFIESRLGLPWDEFNREPRPGYATAEILVQMLKNACFALLLMTAEDEHADRSLHARENVIHEIGLFQGYLGMRRAIILIEEGCAEFSNVHGLSQIRFPEGNVKAAFEEIRKVLERERILQSR